MSSMRECLQGHKYSKSSSCPICPICANEDKPTTGLMSLLGAPARRALLVAGIKTVKQLSKYREAEILALHGMGPSSMPILRKALKDSGLKFN